MKNEYLYGVMGLLVGIVVSGGFYLMNRNNGYGGMMHSMSNETTKCGGVMDIGHQMGAMSASLKGKTGDAFDKEFLAQMIVHHVGAVDMAKLVLATSKRSELIELANDIISAQEKEITQMKQWQKAWFE